MPAKSLTMNSISTIDMARALVVRKLSFAAGCYFERLEFLAQNFCLCACVLFTSF